MLNDSVSYKFTAKIDVLNDRYNSLYSGIYGKALSTSDLLAIGRNKLAIKRTLLAYVRTCLSFIVAGVSLIQFFNERAFVLLGYGLIPFGFLILVIGLMGYFREQKALNSLIVQSRINERGG